MQVADAVVVEDFLRAKEKELLQRDDPVARNRIKLLRSRGHYLVSQYAVAMEGAEAGYAQAVRLVDRLGQCWASNTIGLCHFRSGEYDRAMKWLMTGLGLSRDLGDARLEAAMANNIGLVYVRTKDFGEAERHFREVLRMSQERNFALARCAALTNLGHCLLEAGRLDEARETLDAALADARAIPLPTGEAEVLLDQGVLAIREGNVPEALKKMGRAHLLAKSLGDREVEARCLLQEGEALAVDFEIGRKEESFLRARGLFEEVLTIGEFTRAPLIVCQAHYASYKLLKSRGDASKALEHLENYLALHRQVEEEESGQRLRILQVTHKVRQADEARRHAQERTRELLALNTRLAALNEEVTQQKKELAIANEHLKRHQEEQNLFLGMAAHDLKDPLASVLGLADLLMDEGGDMPMEECHQFIRQIHVTCERALGFIGKMLDYNRLDLGKVSVCRVPCKVAEIATSVVSFYERAAKAKNISLSASLEAEPCLEADPELLRQVIENLVSNAVKYTPPGGKVLVRVEELQVPEPGGKGISRPACKLSVSDSGPGIPAKALHRLFMPFARLGPVPTGGESSTGLGLAIVKRLSDLLGARLEFCNLPEGGACFEVFLFAGD